MNKTVNGASVPASSFLVVEDPEHPSTWHLQVKDENGNADHRLMGAAFAALTVGYRGNKYDGPQAEEAMRKLKALYAAEGMDVPKQADEPTPSDVHVDSAIGSVPASPFLKKLVQRIKDHFTGSKYMTADQFNSHLASARGHAGGVSKRNAEMGPGTAEVCAACAAGDTADCTCPACQEGAPDDCICQQIMADEGPMVAGERHPATVKADHETFRMYVEAPKEFMEPPERIPLLPKPGAYKHPSYGTIDFSANRNANFVRNFQNAVYQTRVPIDAEHETKLSGALGWLTGMHQNTDGSVDGSVEWTDRGKSMLAADRFRYVSPEWYDSWGAPDTGVIHDDVLIGAALTTRPFLKEGSLRPLVANEYGIRIGDDPRVFSPEPTGSTQRPQGQENNMAIQLTEDEIRRFREMETEFAASKTAAEEARAELAESKKAAEAAQEQAKSAAERADRLEAENRRRAFAEQAQTWHGDVNEHVSFMEALPSDEMRDQYSERQEANAIALAEAQKHVFRSHGFAGTEDEGSAQRRYVEAVKSLQASEKLSYSDAVKRVASEQPELARDYRKETVNRS